MLRIEAIANPTVKSPEQIHIEQKILHELYDALGQISEREQTYLLYRYGFTDDTGHTLIAKKTLPVYHLPHPKNL